VNRIHFAAACAVLAGCGGQSNQDPAGVNFVAAAGELRPTAESIPAAWESCETVTYDSIGNRWWGGFTACQGTIRVDIEADSVTLGGPSVRIVIRTPSCPSGRGAGGGSFARAVFERPFEGQLAEVKRIVTQSLTQIDEACGGPAPAPELLGRQFDAEFLDLASRYWLHLSAAGRQRSWTS